MSSRAGFHAGARRRLPSRGTVHGAPRDVRAQEGLRHHLRRDVDQGSSRRCAALCEPPSGAQVNGRGLTKHKDRTENRTSQANTLLITLDCRDAYGGGGTKFYPPAAKKQPFVVRPARRPRRPSRGARDDPLTRAGLRRRRDVLPRRGARGRRAHARRAARRRRLHRRVLEEGRAGARRRPRSPAPGCAPGLRPSQAAVPHDAVIATPGDTNTPSPGAARAACRPRAQDDLTCMNPGCLVYYRHYPVAPCAHVLETFLTAS